LAVGRDHGRRDSGRNPGGLAAAKGADGLIQPGRIADIYWWVHRQPRDAWTFELDVRPFKPTFRAPA
jgi:hypothetical protein